MRESANNIKQQGKTNENINIVSAIKLAFLKFGLPPRHHQVRSIVKIIADLASFEHKDKGKVRNYLIQQAAGSGKSCKYFFIEFFVFSLSLF